MKDKTLSYVRVGWYVLTEVPGWPDAPVRVRLVRSLPILFPLFVTLCVVLWQVVYYAPSAEAEKQKLLPLITLDQEISALQVANSAQQIAELEERAEAAARLLLSNPKDLTPLLKELKAAAAKKGWDATFLTNEATDDPASADEAAVVFLPVRGKFKAKTVNQERFSSFLAVLEHLSSHSKRIDLTRVTIRADESRWQTVEVNFRLLCSASNAKTP